MTHCARRCLCADARTDATDNTLAEKAGATARPMACTQSRYWQEQQLMEQLINTERRTKEEHRRQPGVEPKSLPNTPPADPTCHELLAPRDETFRESDTLSEIGNARAAAPSRASVALDAGRVCAPLIFAESASAKTGTEFARCSRGSRSVGESSFITMRQFAGSP
jgi:hypothetical protein